MNEIDNLLTNKSNYEITDKEFFEVMKYLISEMNRFSGKNIAFNYDSVHSKKDCILKLMSSRLSL
jgi:uncharacterized membrane protein YcgQ (UPF0703/DUF1980 family)